MCVRAARRPQNWSTTAFDRFLGQTHGEISGGHAKETALPETGQRRADMGKRYESGIQKEIV